MSRFKSQNQSEISRPYGSNITLGRSGEAAALKYLIRNGFQLICRNWRCKAGELDLVLYKGDTLIFCEVKTMLHGNDSAFNPCDRVNYEKERKLLRLGEIFWDDNFQMIGNLKINFYRFDIIGVIWSGPFCYKVEHLTDVFS